MVYNRHWGWRRRIDNIRIHFKNDKLSNFLNWSTIRATMHVGDAPYIVDMFNVLYESGERERWMSAIQHNTIGGAHRSKLFPDTNGSMIVNAHHLYMWERVSGKRIDEVESIIEFGGGYGAFCLICHRMGFSGAYHIIDFDEISVISDYYLKGNGIHIVHEIGKTKFDLMVAIHSISEADTSTGNGFVSKYNAKHHAIGYSFVSKEYIDYLFIHILGSEICSSDSITHYLIN